MFSTACPESFRRRLGALSLSLAVVLVAAGPAGAQTDPAQQPPRVKRAEPLFVFQISAVDRVLLRVKQSLESIERSDVIEALDGFLTNTAGNLDGLDRTKPLGVALFLPMSIPPRPVSVMYAPVTNLEQLIATMELRPGVQLEELPGSTKTEPRYRISSARGGSRTLIVRDGYAFISGSEDLLDANVSTLARLAPQLDARYNVAATLRIQAVDPLLRNVFLGYFRAQTQAQLQRRDDEALPKFIARKANAISTLEFIERLLRDGDRITLGMDIPEDSEQTVIELDVEATPDSQFAAYLADFAGQPSSYAALINEQQPLTISASWQMEERERTAGHGWIASLEQSLNDRLALLEAIENPVAGSATGEPAADVGRPEVRRVIDPLRAMIDAGHLDLCVQFRALEGNHLGLVGALHLVGGESFATGLRDLLARLESGDDADVTLDVAEHQGIAFHRFATKNGAGFDRRLYGEGSGLYLGASSRTLWFAVGPRRVLTELESAVDRVAAAASAPASRAPPMQLVLRMNKWINLPAPEDASPDRGELSHAAFTPDNDMLRIEVRPTERGARLRAELDPGFTRLLMLLISRQYDRSRL